MFGERGYLTGIPQLPALRVGTTVRFPRCLRTLQHGILSPVANRGNQARETKCEPLGCECHEGARKSIGIGIRGSEFSGPWLNKA